MHSIRTVIVLISSIRCIFCNHFEIGLSLQNMSFLNKNIKNRTIPTNCEKKESIISEFNLFYL